MARHLSQFAPHAGRWPGVLLLASLTLLGVTALPAAAQGDGVACRGRDHHGWLDTSGWTEDVVVEGSIAYVAAREAGLLVVDFSDPRSPAVLGTLDTPGVARHLSVVGTTVYLACETGGVRIIDASNPADPFEIYSFKFTPQSLDVEVVGGLAFVATYDDGLQIVDVSLPFLPRLLSEDARFTRAFGVAVAGETAVVAGGADGSVRILDVRNPAAPAVLAEYDTGGSASSVTLRGSTLFVPAADGVHILDISTPSAPTLLAVQPMPGSPGAGPVTLVDQLAYVSNGSHGIFVMDIADPANPVGLGTFDTRGGGGTIGVSGTTAVVSDYQQGLYFVDISRPGSSVIASLEILANAYAMTRVGDLLYIAGLQGMQVVDIANPLVPEAIGHFRTNGSAADVGVAGTFAYLAAGRSGLLVLDINNPAQPELVGEYTQLNDAGGIDIVGNVAVVTTNPLTLLDISEPSAPSLLSTFETPGDIQDVAIDGDLVYIADRAEGLRIVDISDPRAPREIGHAPTASSARRVVVADNVAYISCDSLLMFDVRNPAAPALLNSYSRDFGSLGEVEVRGDLMYLATTGLQMVNIAGLHEPTEPVWIGSQVGIDARAVEISGELAFVVGGGTLSVVDLRDCDCFVDLNRDGRADSRDFLAFLNAWASGDSAADWNSDGEVDTHDVTAYRTDWSAGC